MNKGDPVKWLGILVAINNIPDLSGSAWQSRIHLPPSNFDPTVPQRPDSTMEAPADRLVRHPFVLHRLIEHPRHSDKMPVRNSPERANHVPEPGELEGMGKMESLVG
ncbi:hypothetical protein FGADI_764 [Fusarium gaditjirri]|uniref:Uncharacterized protein n=1 Tax=Fusarium gaditjirri TaxID=282569 RepID=A0A8H4TME5_9HYPO|nr:hypothetical protein FGADI_764 [Fusarium gaditjirri]